MSRVELKYGTPEEFEREDLIEPSSYQLSEHGLYMKSPFGSLYTAERGDKAYVSWGLAKLDVRRPNGENALEDDEANFVDLRLEGNNELILTADGYVHRVRVRLIDEPGEAEVGANVLPPLNRRSASVRLKPFLEFDNR